MNTLKVINNNADLVKLEMGQIYQKGCEFYIVAKKGNNPVGCLICLSNGNLWNDEPVEVTLKENPDFELFRGEIKLTTDY